MRTISIGKQDFAFLRENDCFYVDKTAWIREWWENMDEVTLIARPRRFGKTLNMRMLECFFSDQYEGRKDLFEGLSIWQEEKYWQLQGTYPVIFFTLSAAKGNTYEMVKKQICGLLEELYKAHEYLLDGNLLSENEKKEYRKVSMDMDEARAGLALQRLCGYLRKYSGKKVILLLDEYDAPMQEAYVNGYWEELVAFMRSMLNATFKANPHLERAIMTGITRVSKESIFSDLNNLKVVTTTSNMYASAFGFTEEEVFAALEEAGMADEREKVKAWYDGFTFGKETNIYNPWSITNLLKEKSYQTYWAATSSNSLVSSLIRSGKPEVKQKMEDLLEGKSICTAIDEQVVFNQLDRKKDAVWGLLLASGYLKVLHTDFSPERRKNFYELTLTNREVQFMFEDMISDWFTTPEVEGGDFIRAMLAGDLKAMNYYMNEVALSTFSFFDAGNRPSGRMEPERFYHGFVLGLLVDQREDYQVKSNRESGFGRYDMMMIPRRPEENSLPAFVLEFKVRDDGEEETLKDTVAAALRQIAEKNYDAELIGRGIAKECIRHYGFAFEGKKVLIGTEGQDVTLR